MNWHNLQQNNAKASLEDMRGSDNICYQKGPIICPKPRRVMVWPNMSTGLLNCQISQHCDGPNSEAEVEAELLDIILKESYGEEQHGNQEASSPPYFLVSPPARASNPLIQDAHFGYEKQIPESISAISSSSSSSASGSSSCLLSSPSSPLQKGGWVRMKLGNKSAVVRVVGFDCHVPLVA